MMGGAKAHYDGIVAFSQTDFTEDLKKITVPVLVMHGDDDQIVPHADSAPLSAKLLKNGMHAVVTTDQAVKAMEQVNRSARHQESSPLSSRISNATLFDQTVQVGATGARTHPYSAGIGH